MCFILSTYCFYPVALWDFFKYKERYKKKCIIIIRVIRETTGELRDKRKRENAASSKQLFLHASLLRIVHKFKIILLCSYLSALISKGII